MKVRLLTKSDIKETAAIVGKNYSKKWEKSATLELKDMFGKAAINPTYLVAEEKNEILGFAGYMQSWMDYGIYQIFWVNVLPEKQKQGIGKKLVTKAIGQIKKKKGASLILLTADESVGNPKYYKNNWGFKTLQLFNRNTYHLMSLSLELSGPQKNARKN